MTLDFPDIEPLEAELKERILDLADRVKELAFIHLAPRQHLIYSLLMEGHGQTEIADMLRITPAAITFALHGNRVYIDGSCRHRPGIIEKLRLVGDQDPRCLELLQAMQALRQEIASLT